MKNIAQLLEELTNQVPPAEGCRHNMTWSADDGLKLTLMLPAPDDDKRRFSTIVATFTEQEMTESGIILAEKIAKDVKACLT